MKNLGSIGSLILALLVGVGVFAVSYWTASRARESTSDQSVDQLAWVCREFQLTDAELERIRLYVGAAQTPGVEPASPEDWTELVATKS